MSNRLQLVGDRHAALAEMMAKRQGTTTSNSTSAIISTKPPFDVNIPVFLYGSLMAPEILGSALGVAASEVEYLLRPEHAVLPGYVRHKVEGASFPAIVPARTEPSPPPQVTQGVQGIVVRLRNAADADKLDDMERVYYRRELVEVRLANDDEGSVCQAYAYVWKGLRNELSEEEWDYDSFVNTHLPDWLK